ncbi:Aromatic ring-opening dioxygenase, LigB subunit [Acetitomaculum ruminis DSM 5522]|uniref:Aromatic ring-opening dioxygenase, LigB subunit n=1 Tax=Acetitomaculum ruminis DSM 5522 TaxID=1120918 RepID=A0A1I0Z1M8_9FIRM|nr:AMMECR1 domain-containing protein [Acetitomaculum ruminis]SFB18348.1 Aromatic ring-opening dioxygenase, LigB subunit [Acetitomaculum ruminis DSM 5522]
MSIISTYVLPHAQALIPEISKDRISKFEATTISYNEIAEKIAAIEPETIIIINSHEAVYGDYFHINNKECASGDFSAYGAGNVKFSFDYDTELVKAIENICLEKDFPAGTEGEDKPLSHGIMVPLYYLNKYIKNEYKVVSISISGLGNSIHYKFGQLINDAVEATGRKAIVIASGDFSHRVKKDSPFGYHKNGALYDGLLTTALRKTDFLNLFGFEDDMVLAATECVLMPITIMAGCLDGKNPVPDFKSYEAPFGIGMCVCGFTIDDFEENDSTRRFLRILNERILDGVDRKIENAPNAIKISMITLQTLLTEDRIIDANELPKEITDPLINDHNGVFVSFKINKRARGSMGSFTVTTSNVVTEIITMTVAAASNDLRFKPITLEELDAISVTVDIIEPLESIQFLNQVNHRKHGLYIEKDGVIGLCLPNAQDFKSSKQMLEIALAEAGFKEDDDYKMYRFDTMRFTL